MNIKPTALNDDKIICPACNCENVHVTKSEFRRSEDYTGYEGVRGDAVVVDSYCESGHRFDLVLGQHKGTLYFYVGNIRDEHLS
jgi:hypothetical protein